MQVGWHPSTSTKVPRDTLWTWFGASASRSTGVAHDCGETSSASHSARVFSKKRAAMSLRVRPMPHEYSSWGTSTTKPATQLGIELRLQGTHREVLTISRLIGPVVVRSAVHHVGVALVDPAAISEHAVEHRGQGGGGVEHRDVDHLARP